MVAAGERGAEEVELVEGAASTLDLAHEAINDDMGLRALVQPKGFSRTVDLEAAYRDGGLTIPARDPDTSHSYLTGTVTLFLLTA